MPKTGLFEPKRSRCGGVRFLVFGPSRLFFLCVDEPREKPLTRTTKSRPARFGHGKRTPYKPSPADRRFTRGRNIDETIAK